MYHYTRVHSGEDQRDLKAEQKTVYQPVQLDKIAVFAFYWYRRRRF